MTSDNTPSEPTKPDTIANRTMPSEIRVADEYAILQRQREAAKSSRIAAMREELESARRDGVIAAMEQLRDRLAAVTKERDAALAMLRELVRVPYIDDRGNPIPVPQDDAAVTPGWWERRTALLGGPGAGAEAVTAERDARDVAAYCAFLWHHGQHREETKP